VMRRDAISDAVSDAISDDSWLGLVFLIVFRIQSYQRIYDGLLGGVFVCVLLLSNE